MKMLRADVEIPSGGCLWETRRTRLVKGWNTSTFGDNLLSLVQLLVESRFTLLHVYSRVQISIATDPGPRVQAIEGLIPHSIMVEITHTKGG